jgi:hypothetical protein
VLWGCQRGGRWQRQLAMLVRCRWALRVVAMAEQSHCLLEGG